jgi:shikimate kinase
MDLDDVVEEVAGRSISEIFATEGELAFRQKELEALKTIAGGWMSKTKSLPRLRRGPLPFTGPRAATVFDTPTTDNASCSTELRKCQFRPTASAIHAIDNPDIQLQQISERGAAVLALGGGTVMTPECAELVKENTLCIYLRASIDTLVKHLSSEAAKRPLLTATDKSLHSRIEELMSQRTSTYEKTANIIIDTDGKSIEQICSEITNLI